MSEPAQKQCYFYQNYALKVFIAFKMAYFCYFSFGGNLDFPDFLQKKFYNIDYRRLDYSIITEKIRPIA